MRRLLYWPTSSHVKYSHACLRLYSTHMRPPHAWTTDNKGLGDKLLCILVTEALLLHDKRVDIAQEVPKYVTNQVLADYYKTKINTTIVSKTSFHSHSDHSIGDRYESELGHMYKTSGRSLTGVRAEVGRLMKFLQEKRGNREHSQITWTGNDFDVGTRLLNFLVADVLDQRPTSKDSSGNDTVGHDVQFYINKQRCLVPYSRARLTSNHDDFDGQHPLNMTMLNDILSDKTLDIHFKTKLARGWTPGSNTFGELVPFVEDLMKWVDDNNVDDKADIQEVLNANSRRPSILHKDSRRRPRERRSRLVCSGNIRTRTYDRTSVAIGEDLWTKSNIMTKKSSEDENTITTTGVGVSNTIISSAQIFATTFPQPLLRTSTNASDSTATKSDGTSGKVTVISPDLVKEAVVPVTAERGPLSEHSCRPRTIKWFSRGGHQYAFDVFPCCGQVVRTDAATGQKYSRYECTKQPLKRDYEFKLFRAFKSQAASKKPIATWESYVVTSRLSQQQAIKFNTQLATVSPTRDSIKHPQPSSTAPSLRHYPRLRKRSSKKKKYVKNGRR